MPAGTDQLRLSALMLIVALLVLGISGCGGEETSSEEPTFVVGAIPDQNVSDLTRRFELFTDYLSRETGLRVEYTRSNDYAALVTAFRRGDVHLAWFGGLTGVQARRAVPGSEAIAQRPRDRNFHSKFIVRADLDVRELSDLKGKTVTFGDENSTSGHLMPRHYLLEAGVNPEEDFAAKPNYSGSHDRTWKLVESGAYQAGALNEAVWRRAVRENQVDTGTVRAFYTTPSYYDYNWTLHADVDETFGPGTADSVRRALLGMGEQQRDILDLFRAEAFVSTKNENYTAIAETAEDVGILR